MECWRQNPSFKYLNMEKSYSLKEDENGKELLPKNGMREDGEGGKWVVDWKRN